MVTVTIGGCLAPVPSIAQAPPASLQALVELVQDADFRGDLPALARLHGEMQPFLSEPLVARDARYWRGFALWRRSLNSANLALPVQAILDDLDGALAEFDSALALDSSYVEATIGAAAALMNAAHFRFRDFERSSELMARAVRLLRDAERRHPDNPRMVFLAAARTFWAPPEYGGDKRRAIERVEKLLERLPANPASGHPLEPKWGLAELHMQLGFFYLNLDPPDPASARRHAQAALEAHPDWHYVREILLPQIEAAAR